MWVRIRKFFGLKGDTRVQSDDKYISRLNGKAKEDIAEVTANLRQLQSEIMQFKETVDKLTQQFPGQQK